MRVNDHDFESLADGKIVPHGLYDIHRNRGYIVLGTSHDTSEFGCACIRHWWLNHGRWDYPKATSILLLCDCGGSNNARHFIFKEDLQTLADDLGIEIRIAHYPPYTSKYNPIEHRLFPHITKACSGVIFTSVELAKAAMSQAKTSQGLKVFISIIDRLFETGRKVIDGFATESIAGAHSKAGHERDPWGEEFNSIVGSRKAISSDDIGLPFNLKMHDVLAILVISPL